MAPVLGSGGGEVRKERWAAVIGWNHGGGGASWLGVEPGKRREMESGTEGSFVSDWRTRESSGPSRIGVDLGTGQVECFGGQSQALGSPQLRGLLGELGADFFPWWPANCSMLSVNFGFL